MSGIATLTTSSRRIDSFATYMGLATIMLAMVVCYTFLISSSNPQVGDDIISHVEIDELTAFELTAVEAFSLGQAADQDSDFSFQSQKQDSVQAAIHRVSIFDRVFSGEELCIAQAVYFEARGEPLAGQLAVAEVIRNRVEHRRYPSDACRVVFQNERKRHRCQFSFACDGKSDRPRDVAAWEIALKVVALVTSGQLTTIASNATHYHATYVKPRWRTSFNRLGQIGRHIFYSDGSA